jgi:excisionase family DNA binding protein
MTNSPRTTGRPVDFYSALAHEWERLARSPQARSSFRRWRQASPLLAGFPSPGHITAAITHSDQPARSAPLLAALLEIATRDPLARHAVLTAIIPQLRSIATRRWKLAGTDGLWVQRQDLDGEVISLAWLAIANASGQHPAPPAQSVVRQVERQLRTIHQSYRRTLRRTIPFQPDLAPVQPAGNNLPPLESTTTLLLDAVRSGQLDPIDAAIAYQVAVAGRPLVRVTERFGLTRNSAQRSLRAARAAMERPGIHPPLSPARKEAAHVPANNRPTPLPLLLTVHQASQLIGVSRTTLYKLMDTGQLAHVHIGASRRVPLQAAHDYVAHLCAGLQPVRLARPPLGGACVAHTAAPASGDGGIRNEEASP